MNRFLLFSLLIATIIVAITACSKSPEEKAKALINCYIMENADDPESYEALEFGPLDTFDRTIIFSKRHQDLFKYYDDAPEGSLWQEVILKEMAFTLIALHPTNAIKKLQMSDVKIFDIS